jgi:type IV pilus assembly protein PilB
VGKALSELESELSSRDTEVITKDDKSKKETTQIIEDAPVTKIVATILRYATEGNASDIHIEPQSEKVRVRFRVDGILHTSLILPLKVHRAVVARIKVLSNVKLDERRKPQDGRFSARMEGRKLDFRVSTLPTYYGEKVEIRILDQERGVKDLDMIGLESYHLEAIRRAIKRPYGLILISGPTGSGKTTTLYAMLNEMDREQKNVLSLEDPIEYNIDGVNQSQVMPEIGYTFANGLRSVLRQDPDVIMVGEIRDKETAELAVQAALTGHLVFSTIHTNNAVGVVTRLIEMGIDPYLIGPTLILAIAQRLVKLLCPGAGRPVPVEGSIKIMIDKQFEDLPERFRKKLTFGNEVYEAAPMPNCPSGTRGRIGAFEVLEMNSELERTILEGKTEADIHRVAREHGMLSLKEDAIIKAFNKVIPFEEVNTL